MQNIRGENGKNCIGLRDCVHHNTSKQNLSHETCLTKQVHLFKLKFLNPQFQTFNIFGSPILVGLGKMNSKNKTLNKGQLEGLTF